MTRSDGLLEELLFTFLTVALLSWICRFGIYAIDVFCGSLGLDEFTAKTLCYAYAVLVGLSYTLRRYEAGR